MKIKTFLIGVIVAAGLQTAALAKIIYDHRSLLVSGQEVYLETGFVDPRDLFRGHYVTLRLLISNPERHKVEIDGTFGYRDDIFMVLKKGEGVFWEAASIHKTYPVNPGGPVIKGTAMFTSTNLENSASVRPTVSFPFDRYFAPKLKAQELENLRRNRKLGVILSLGDDGKGLIKGVTIDGDPIYEEGLF
ncbi:GDYXXLXY domain-containing protein [Alphaproteobacteria bacterium]|nr:GDYXXLXY domain-containing protein [Alphaproteobacteria bacterium]